LDSWLVIFLWNNKPARFISSFIGHHFEGLMPASTPLKRSLKLTAVTFYGVGAILGAGIYILIGEVVSTAGYYAPLSFLLAAIIAFFSAFSYAELSARFPRSAGEAVYIAEAFNQKSLTQVVGLLVIVTGIVSAATMATGIVGYVHVFAGVPSVLIIVVFVALIGAIAIWGIEEAAWIVMLITLLEIGGLIYVIVVATDNATALSITKIVPASFANGDVINGIFLASFIAFYAYIGFEDMVNIAEEIQQPEKTLPRAIILALIISTTLYMLVIFAALSALPPEYLGASAAPLADVLVAKGESAAWISLVSLIAVINGAIVQLIMASRVIYGMASTGLLPKGLADVNAYTATPVRASMLCIVATLVLALLFPLASLAQLTSVIVLVVFALINIALIRINFIKPHHKTIHYPNWFPFVGAMLCIAMLLIKILFILAT
jgi:amino acid transporter